MDADNCRSSVNKLAALNVTISGGGPVGLTFALLLENLLGSRVAITVYEARWMFRGAQVVWKGEDQGNIRRQQVVTIQSRHFLRLPKEIQDLVFQPGKFSQMWPIGPDCIDGIGPRNVRIAHLEDQLLVSANESLHIKLIPQRFDPDEMSDELKMQHVLAICEGRRSEHDGSLKYFVRHFGAADQSLYALNGKSVQDVVLGLQVESDLPDAAAVLLTISQNRFLLNSVHGDGFLNMRLTDSEARGLTCLHGDGSEAKDCFRSHACVFRRVPKTDVYRCMVHATVFSPAIEDESPLWTKIRDGLKFLGVRHENLKAVTVFRLGMAQRPRFTAELFPAMPGRPALFGFLLGDTANAVHFWPGRGLNGGLASAISLARCLKARWHGLPFRDSDFLRHEAAMAMLQYRHKSRAWRFMVQSDTNGNYQSIKDKIEAATLDSLQEMARRQADISALLQRMNKARERLASRIEGLPSELWLKSHLSGLRSLTLREMVESGGWDSFGGGGEEVEIDWLLRGSSDREM